MRVANPDQTLNRLRQVSLSRDSAMLGRRPLPPKPVSLVGGVLTWEEPKETANVTHYDVYLSRGVLFARLPVGQTKITGFPETKAFLKSFDDRTQIESYELAISGTAAPSSSSPTGPSISLATFGAKGDLQYTQVKVTSGSAIVDWVSGARFSVSDVGKRIVIYGGGSGANRVSYQASTPTVLSTVDAYTATAPIDAQNATAVKIAVNCETNDVTWEVFGATLADYSDEVLIDGPHDQGAKAASGTWTTSSPTKRYYRTKIKNKTAGLNAVAYASPVSLGKMIGGNILSVQSPTRVTISLNATSNRDNAYCYFGTDETAKIQLAFDTLTALVPGVTADGGSVIQETEQRKYLISAPIFQKHCVTINGVSGGGTIFQVDGEAFPVSTPVWNMTGTFGADARIAFYTRLMDVRIDCGHVPGSIGVYCDALQENSGLYRTTVIGWRSKGIQVGSASVRYGNTNWRIQDPWVFPSNAAFADDSVRGIDINYAPTTTIARGTVYGQANFVCGHGVAIEVNNGNVRVDEEIHFESARVGILFGPNAGGFVLGGTTQSHVYEAVRVQGGSPVKVINFASLGKFALVDEVSGASYGDFAISEYDTTALPKRTRGGQGGSDIEQWVPSSFYSGQPSLRINTRGNLLAQGGFSRKSPNVLGLGAGDNFDAPTQGGWITTNAESLGYPNWGPTSGWNFSADPATDTLMLFDESGNPGHAFANNDPCEVGSLGALPAGLASATTYYAINVNAALGTLQLATAPSGSPINITSSGGVNTLYIAASLRAAWYRHGATRFEVRVGRVPNTQGVDPGTLVFRSDGDQGNFSPWDYFDTPAGLGARDFGNKGDVNRAQWQHGQSAQKLLSLLRSTDSGVTFTDDMLRCFLDIGATQLFWLWFDGVTRLNFGNDHDVNRARWEHGQAGQATLDLQRSTNSGSTWASLIKFMLSTGQVVFGGGINLASFAASLPLRTDSSKNVTTGPIDVGIAGDTAATGITNGHLIKWNGTLFADAGPPSTLTSPVPVANGGTGSTTAAGARSNLDVYGTADVDTLIATEAGARGAGLAAIQVQIDAINALFVAALTASNVNLTTNNKADVVGGLVQSFHT